jgi:hypothetical protein
MIEVFVKIKHCERKKYHVMRQDVIYLILFLANLSTILCFSGGSLFVCFLQAFLGSARIVS